MMAKGRTPNGSRIVDRLESSAEAKERLKVVLETLTGSMSVAEARKRLDVSEQRFHQIREEALRGALAGLEPKPKGRPPKRAPEEDAELATAKEENRRLRIDLRAAQTREEIAVAMPHLLKPRQPWPGKKTSGKAGRKKR